MSSGFELYNGNQDFRILDGTRTVLTTEGMLINLLPPEEDIDLTFSVIFPDFSKDYLYNWQHIFGYTSLGNSVGYDSACQVQLTIPEQSFEDEINLMAAPTSSDIFVGSITMNRTSAPSHTWNGLPINPLQKMGSLTPFISGSVLAEAAIGMARAFSIYVSGGFLKLHRDQSVSTAPGGWGGYGTTYDWVNPADGGGGENVFGSNPGIPVLLTATNDVAAYQVSPANSPVGTVPSDTRTRRGGPNACAIPNPASFNYGSTYSVNLKGAFGRRS